MCGIVGAIAERNVVQILIEGLRRLEYRGYDSAGIAVINSAHEIQRLRAKGKVQILADKLTETPLAGELGIAHTRWATHGKPSTSNAHPHCSDNKVALVHNGIIENDEILRDQLIEHGYNFVTDTDTEVIAHLIHYYMQPNQPLLHAIQRVTQELVGAYSLGIMTPDEPDTLYAVRRGSPLVIGVGFNEHFIGSDPLALLPVTQKFVYLEDGDIAKLTKTNCVIYDEQTHLVERHLHTIEADFETACKGNYRHYMQKEIFEQPNAILETINSHVRQAKIIFSSFAHEADQIFNQVERIHLVACGTSYHAGLIAAYWLEELASIPVRVDIASEFRYRNVIVEPNTLFIALSQSGETADTLAALYNAKEKNYLAYLGICNVPESTLARNVDLLFLTHAGMEIGVAATKTFSAQLLALLLLTLAIREQKSSEHEPSKEYIATLKHLPSLIKEILKLDADIQTISQKFIHKNNALFLGRGIHYPVVMEGALKLKEISYMHAEAYPAGELKHGPLALVDKDMPVIVIAPKDHLSEKLASNVKEVLARNGEVYIFSDESLCWNASNHCSVINIPSVPEILSPFVYTIPLQLLAYHISVLKGTDVDQPRNLAKSVTVE